MEAFTQSDGVVRRRPAFAAEVELVQMNINLTHSCASNWRPAGRRRTTTDKNGRQKLHEYSHRSQFKGFIANNYLCSQRRILYIYFILSITLYNLIRNAARTTSATPSSAIVPIIICISFAYIMPPHVVRHHPTSSVIVAVDVGRCRSLWRTTTDDIVRCVNEP